VFSRVAETRALAAQANRARAARSRAIPAVSCAGSTTSGGSPPVRLTQALIVVSQFYFHLHTLKVEFLCSKDKFYRFQIYRQLLSVGICYSSIVPIKEKSKPICDFCGEECVEKDLF
jgi:hypothetical protein